MCENSASFCSGSPETEIAFVFICPGKEEKNSNFPVAGQTGSNLDIIIKDLNRAKPKLFPKLCRYDPE